MTLEKICQKSANSIIRLGTGTFVFLALMIPARLWGQTPEEGCRLECEKWKSNRQFQENLPPPKCSYGYTFNPETCEVKVAAPPAKKAGKGKASGVYKGYKPEKGWDMRNVPLPKEKDTAKTEAAENDPCAKKPVAPEWTGFAPAQQCPPAVDAKQQPLDDRAILGKIKQAEGKVEGCRSADALADSLEKKLGHAPAVSDCAGVAKEARARCASYLNFRAQHCGTQDLASYKFILGCWRYEMDRRDYEKNNCGSAANGLQE